MSHATGRRAADPGGSAGSSATPRRRSPISRGVFASLSLLFVLFLSVGRITTIAAAEELGNEPAATESEAPAPDDSATEWSEGSETPAPEPTLLLVGPEGGFTADETTAALAAGFEPRGLGPYTLRTETAALVGAAILLNR